MPYPNANITQITSSTACSVGWVNEFNDNLRLLLQDAVRAHGSVTNLKSISRAILTSTGNAKSGIIRHNMLDNVLSDQHHNKSHAKSHIDGSDDIPTASTARKGLVSATTAQKIANIATGATRNWFVLTTYVGNGGADKYITLGFRPAYVQLFYSHSASTATPNMRWQIEAIDGAWKTFRHTDKDALGTLYHVFNNLASTISIGVTGVRVYASCNSVTEYILMACKSDPYIASLYS